MRDDVEIACSCGPVVTNRDHPQWRGADRATNNTGEVSAIIEALRWVKEQQYASATIRYDSQYAAFQTQSKWKAKSNKVLILAARGTLKDAAHALSVGFLHVKGHSGDKWNDRADELAAEGAAACTSETTPPPTRSQPTAATTDTPVYTGVRTVRGVNWDPTETARILRARTRHGVLNLKVQTNRSKAQLEAARCDCERLITREASDKRVTMAQAREAHTRARHAAAQLEDRAMQRLEAAARKRGWYTARLDCTLNVAELQRLKATHGDHVISADDDGAHARTRTFGQAIDGLLAAATLTNAGETVLSLEYRFSALGRDLVDAGHISACREQAEGADPFKLPREIRRAAFSGMGWEMDDSSAFPRARIAMVSRGRKESQFLVDHKEDIMRQYAAYLFPDLEWLEQKRRMKCVINGIDMDSGLDAWAAKYGNPDAKTLKGKRVLLSNGQPYTLEDYQRAQKRSTEDMTAASPRMLTFITAHMKPSERARAHKPALRLKSYLLQEAEAVSRAAKVAQCREWGIRVVSLQHDGIMMESLPDGYTVDETAELMSAAASRQAGYEVIVTAERVRRLTVD